MRFVLRPIPPLSLEQRACEIHALGFTPAKARALVSLAHLMKLAEPLDYDGVRRLVRRWRPYGGFPEFHLLLQSLAEAGRISGC